jgi:hypothetical protein
MMLRRGLALAAVAAALGAPATARADAVTDWNVIATNAIAITAGQSPHGSAPSFAMVQGAVYDAVNAIERSHRPYLVDVGAIGAQPWDSQDAAAATAAYRVLVGMFPSQQPTLQPLYEASLQAVPDGPMEQGGIAAGEAAAAAMLAARQNDGRGGPFTFVIGSEPGDWRPLTPTALDPAPWVGNVRPFLLESPDQLRSKGPNDLTSEKYAKDFAEVKDVGSLTSTSRTADQTTAAIFWQAHPGAIYNRVFREVATAEQLDTSERARLFAMTWLAGADGAISCWNDKYHWNFWRPMAAIREADTDGNPETEADPSWRPLFDPSTVTVPPSSLVTPPFPDHPSGHGCLSGSILHTAQDFFRTDRMEFDVHSSRFPGQPRHFGRFSDALQEIVDARVWGGIHFREADEQGAKIGKKVARWLDKRGYFDRVRGSDKHHDNDERHEHDEGEDD